ncbi:MAG TPA: VCBS repeat-containing protein, partial [Pyrinomonadaceae bacterium]|nr:VCBS repeat-containing protein [Pyrinomonadaceae bacterium]
WFGEDMTVSQYVRNVARTKWLLLDAGEYKKFYDLVGPNWTEIGTMIGEGNSLFRNNRDGTFTELKDSHTNRAGWSWGVAFFDMDNDTDLDIYAANGWITNKNKDDL